MSVENTTAAGLRTGKVLARRRSERWLLETPAGKVTATRAAGCLLEPGIGDLLLVAVAEDGRWFILQVLERGDAARPARLLAPEKSVLLAGDGAGELSLRAGEVAFEGRTLTSRFDRIVTVARSAETRVERWLLECKRAYERATELRESRLGRLRCLVGGLLSLRGAAVDVTAERKLKLDGDSVDVG